MNHRHHHQQMISLEMLENDPEPERAVAYMLTSSLKSIEFKVRYRSQQIDWKSLKINVERDESLLPGAPDVLKMQLSVKAK